MNQEKPTLGFALAALSFLAFHLVLILTQRILPFVDNANHLSAATIFRFYGDPANRFAEFYAVPTLWQPGVFDLLFYSLESWPTVELANHVLFCIVAALLPLSVWLVLRRLGGNPWHALLAYCVLYNFDVHWGFVGFAIAIPVVMFLVLVLLKEHPTNLARHGAVVAALLLLVLSMHALAALFACLVVWALALGRTRRGLPRLWVEGCATLPCLALLFAWWGWRGGGASNGESDVSYLINYYGHDFLRQFPDRARVFLGDFDYLFDGWRGTAFALTIFGAIVALSLSGSITRKGLAIVPAALPRLRSLLILLGCGMACFIALPPALPGQAILYQRYSVFALLALIVMGGVLSRRRFPRLKAVAIGLVVAGYSLAQWDYFKAFSRENDGFVASFFPPEVTSSVLAGVMYDYTFRGSTLFLHSANYDIIWKQGVSTTAIVEYRFGMVRRKVGGGELPPFHGVAFVPAFGQVDFLLVRGQIPDRDRENFRNFTRSRSSGAWALYERN